MTHEKTLIRGGALSGAGVLAVTVTMLVAGKLFTNALPPVAVGAFVLLLAAADFLCIAGGLGVYIALPKLIGGAPPEERTGLAHAIVSGQIWVSLAVGGVVSAIACLAPLGLLFPATPEWQALPAMLWALGPMLMTASLRETLMAALAGLDRYAARTMAMIVPGVVLVAAIYIGLWHYKGGTNMLAVCFIASYAASCAWMFLVFGESKGAFRRDLRRYGDAAKFSFPLYINQLLTFFYQRFDTVLISALLDLRSAAIYEMVKRLPMLVSRFLGALLVPYLPGVSACIAQGNLDESAALLNRAVRLTAFLGYGGMFALVTFREFVVTLLFSSDYLAGASVLGLLLFSICLAVLGGLMGQTLIALGKPSLVTLINIALVIISVGGNWALIPHYGLAGAAWAGIAAIAFSGTLQAFFAMRGGVHIDWRGLLAIHLSLFAGAILMSVAGASLWFRLLAGAAFVTLSLVTGAIAPRELRTVVEALLPQRNVTERVRNE